MNFILISSIWTTVLLAIAWASLAIRRTRVEDICSRRPLATKIPVPEPNPGASKSFASGTVTAFAIYVAVCLATFPFGGNPMELILFGATTLGVPFLVWGTVSTVVWSLGNWDSFTSFFCGAVALASVPWAPIAMIAW